VPLKELNHPATARFLNAFVVDAGLDVDQREAVATALAVIRRFEDGKSAQAFEIGRAAGFSVRDLDVLVGAAISLLPARVARAELDLPTAVDFPSSSPQSYTRDLEPSSSGPGRSRRGRSHRLRRSAGHGCDRSLIRSYGSSSRSIAASHRRRRAG
jgi:hypothetical protein